MINVKFRVKVTSKNLKKVLNQLSSTNPWVYKHISNIYILYNHHENHSNAPCYPYRWPPFHQLSPHLIAPRMPHRHRVIRSSGVSMTRYGDLFYRHQKSWKIDVINGEFTYLLGINITHGKLMGIHIINGKQSVACHMWVFLKCFLGGKERCFLWGFGVNLFGGWVSMLNTVSLWARWTCKHIAERITIAMETVDWGTMYQC